MTENIKVRIEHLKEKMDDSKFRHNEGLSNEVGYYVFDYPADQELYMRKQIIKFKKAPVQQELI